MDFTTVHIHPIFPFFYHRAVDLRPIYTNQQPEEKGREKRGEKEGKEVKKGDQRRRYDQRAKNKGNVTWALMRNSTVINHIRNNDHAKSSIKRTTQSGGRSNMGRRSFGSRVKEGRWGPILLDEGPGAVGVPPPA
jgi:hypothetical protein